jgi:uridylate kinase
MSAVPMPSVCESYTQRGAMKHLDNNSVVIFAGGTGNPFFTTDTCASLRASEIKAEALIKATKVDGVFDSDPAENPKAKRYKKLTYQKVLADRLGVMDLSAVSMCMENDIPIVVLQISRSGNLRSAICGRNVGTLISH